MGKLKRAGRVEATTTATPEQVWAIIADVTRIGDWSHECQAGAWLDGATSARSGARFTGANRVDRARWSRISEIVSADAPHELVWRTVPEGIYRDSTEWRIRLDRTDDGTRITQSFTLLKINPVMERLIYLVMPAHRDRMEALAEDLRRLGDVAVP
jgi:hypothetical protein